MGIKIDSLNKSISVSNAGKNINISSPVPGAQNAAWGTISGNLADQIDLQEKFNKISSGPFIVDGLSDLAEFLDGSVYKLPVNRYFFRQPVDFGTATIDLIDANEIYSFHGMNFNLITYTGTGTFISSTQTGVSLDIVRLFMSSPNGTFVGWTNGNSLLMEIPVFVNCLRCVELDTFAFCTMDIIAIVGCENGLKLTDVATISCQVGQFSSGLNNGGGFMELIGAASERMYLSIADSRPDSTEFYLNVAANYGGLIDVVGGVHTGVGSFFKAGSRDQDDIDIGIALIQNAPASSRKASAYIAEADETFTVITTDGVDVVIAGIWTENIAKRFTTDSGGKFTYIGREGAILRIVAKCQVTPLSGSNREYELYIRKNGTTVDLQSRDIVSPDSGNPEKAILITEMEFATNDYIEIVIRSIGHTQNAECEAVTLAI